MTKCELKDIIKERVLCLLKENVNDNLLNGIKVIPLDQFVRSELDESDMLGATTKVVPPDELQSYLGRVVGKSKTPGEKYQMPYVHPSNIEIKDAQNKTFDLEKLKRIIKSRPATILKQNSKVTHSGGSSSVYFNIGLPALKGLAVNEKTGDFVVVDTCPGAGACKVYCYARQGGYVQFKHASMSQTRLLNFLLNDPEGFKSKLSYELNLERDKFHDKNTKIVVRWHDAGDFFSPDYLELAYSIAREFPDIDFYAYTKIANASLGSKPDNFKINFSSGSNPEQEKQINFTKTKHSTVVPKELFDDLIEKNSSGKPEKNEKGTWRFSPETIGILKDRLSKKYHIKSDSILTYDEMMALPVGKEPKFNVIVSPGDGDDSANRSDVLGTYLLIHK